MFTTLTVMAGDCEYDVIVLNTMQDCTTNIGTFCQPTQTSNNSTHCLQAAEGAANAASGVAEKALQHAALAQSAAESAARDLLLTKTAELQALALLQQKGTDNAAGDLLKVCGTFIEKNTR
jgi:hypothetical protein